MKLDKPVEPVAIDIPALRGKYASERDKRVRPKGNGQYAVVAGEHWLIQATVLAVQQFPSLPVSPESRQAFHRGFLVD